MSNVLLFARNYFFALRKCLYLFTLGTLSTKQRQTIPRICSLFEGGNPRPKSLIPALSIKELVPDYVGIQLRDFIPNEGNVSLVEAIVLAKMVRHASPKKLVEIGTFDGRTTLNMAANSPTDAVVYTLDLPKSQMDQTALQVTPADKLFINKESSGIRYLDTECSAKIVQLYGDSATYDFTNLYGSIDFVFVDGSHSFEYAKSDTALAMRLTTDTGTIVWHDYMVWPGVTAALDEAFKQGGSFRELRHIENTSLAYLERSAK